MSASIEDIKEFLSGKADEEDTKTLKVTRLGSTTGAEQYRIVFIPKVETPAPKKKTASPVTASKSKG